MLVQNPRGSGRQNADISAARTYQLIVHTTILRIPETSLWIRPGRCLVSLCKRHCVAKHRCSSSIIYPRKQKSRHHFCLHSSTTNRPFQERGSSQDEDQYDDGGDSELAMRAGKMPTLQENQHAREASERPHSHFPSYGNLVLPSKELPKMQRRGG